MGPRLGMLLPAILVVILSIMEVVITNRPNYKQYPVRKAFRYVLGYVNGACVFWLLMAFCLFLLHGFGV